MSLLLTLGTRAMSFLCVIYDIYINTVPEAFPTQRSISQRYLNQAILTSHVMKQIIARVSGTVTHRSGVWDSNTSLG